MLCPICDEWDETFDHVWICPSRIQQMQQIIENTKNKLSLLLIWSLLENDKDPDKNEILEINKLEIWDLRYSEFDFTFINLIKGIIPRDLSNYVEKVVGIKHTYDILHNLRNFIYEEIHSNIWIPRCNIQIKKEKLYNINKNLKRNKYKKRKYEKYSWLYRKLDNFNRFNNIDSIKEKIYFGKDILGFMRWVNHAL